MLAEKLPESLRAEFQQQHGIHVRQGYGTAEIGAIAYECEAARGFHLDPGVLVEIVDPQTGAPVEPGTPGEVVCTPLNPVYALLRFATGDLAALDTAPCPCGRTTHRLTAILGRVDQSTKVRGLFLHPAQLTEALAAFPAVERFRAAIVRERAMDDLIIEVVAAAALPHDVRKAIGARVKETTKLGARVVQLARRGDPRGRPGHRRPQELGLAPAQRRRRRRPGPSGDRSRGSSPPPLRRTSPCPRTGAGGPRAAPAPRARGWCAAGRRGWRPRCSP